MLSSYASENLKSEIYFEIIWDCFSRYSRLASVVLAVSVAITLLEVGCGRIERDISI